ncbi:hypothetical protein K437DRAFT_161113 [Tilletiaria anomala UBC 951]|uniref:Uncharacterized protein n=1 Tax=Tilletiaria anomala (strain ATCC 24038 / CBS 436.72 / UBC 951) TaxID=1037660 RepID=A0A066VM13_TILAU|nr:uncharacterized protein K437DRAFT_161113 [Tilletiaria anomala UBC 951]KDN42526.1 hypothetical protein K437DRAFT_161113 [Tilletiaria anomala UBC 951]
MRPYDGSSEQRLRPYDGSSEQRLRPYDGSSEQRLRPLFAFGIRSHCSCIRELWGSRVARPTERQPESPADPKGQAVHFDCDLLTGPSQALHPPSRKLTLREHSDHTGGIYSWSRECGPQRKDHWERIGRLACSSCTNDSCGALCSTEHRP